MEMKKEEVEQKINELKPVVQRDSAGGIFEIVSIEGMKATLRLSANPGIGTFKVQGKITGPKEITLDVQKKVAAKLKALGITAKFVD